MDANKRAVPPPRPISLPGIETNVYLPPPSDTLRHEFSEKPIPLDSLHPIDATLVGLGMCRQLVQHWRDRNIAVLGLSPAEAEQFDAPQTVHHAIIAICAHAAADDAGESWGALSDHEREYRIDQARVIVQTFIEAIHRV